MDERGVDTSVYCHCCKLGSECGQLLTVFRLSSVVFLFPKRKGGWPKGKKRRPPPPGIFLSPVLLGQDEMVGFLTGCSVTLSSPWGLCWVLGMAVVPSQVSSVYQGP